MSNMCVATYQNIKSNFPALNVCRSKMYKYKCIYL